MKDPTIKIQSIYMGNFFSEGYFYALTDYTFLIDGKVILESDSITLQKDNPKAKGLTEFKKLLKKQGYEAAKIAFIDRGSPQYIK